MDYDEVYIKKFNIKSYDLLETQYLSITSKNKVSYKKIVQITCVAYIYL